MGNIILDESIRSPIKLRKTLERYHWFAAKHSFLAPRGTGTSVSDDQFIYGIAVSSLDRKETDFLQELLRVFFLPSLVDNPAKLDIFTYHPNGNALEMYSSEEKDLSIRINLWTGAVVKCGFRIAQSNRIINSSRFQKYFDEKSRAQALNGTALEVAGKLVYVLPNFKGSSYILVGCTGLAIYRKWDGFWYFWDEFDSRFDSPSFNYWTKKLKIFTRYETSKIKKTIGFLGDETNPILRITENQETNEIKIAISNFVDGDGWLLLDRVERDEAGNSVEGADFKVLQRHLDSFAQYDLFAAKDDYGKFVVICPLYRLAEDPKRPLVFREVENFENETQFDVLNVPGMKVSVNQSLGGISGLPGALVIVVNSKKSLLLPLHRIDFNFKRSNNSVRMNDNIVKIQKIPIFNDVAAPQTRMDRLLLAFYFILSYDYNSALKLLNPTYSILHNEPFSSTELDVIEWIVKIKSSAPEIDSFKILSCIHLKLNHRKFPKCSDLKEKSKSISDILHDKNDNRVLSYMFAIRELPEKFYIHRIFPEILTTDIYQNIMNYTKPKKSEVFGFDFDLLEDPRDHRHLIWIKTFDYKKAQEYVLGSLVNEEMFIQALNGRFSLENLETILKLMPRIFKAKDNSISGKDFAIAILCHVKEPELWQGLKRIIVESGKIESSLARKNYLKRECNKIIGQNFKNYCFREYAKYFDGVNQSMTKTSTSFETIKSTMQSDLKNMESNHSQDSIEDTHFIELVEREDLNEFQSIMFKLRNLTQSEGTIENLIYFHEDIKENSKILKGLELSISEYVREKESNDISQVYFKNHPVLFDDLCEFGRFLTQRIEHLRNEQTTDYALLSEMMSSETHLSIISSIFSQMHQKKSNTFSNLYACYLRDSVSCFQQKFPELSITQCLEIKKIATEFFGRQILIDYFGMLKGIFEKFLIASNQNQSVSVDELKIFCDELSKIEDFNERLKDPVIMNFEFRSGKYRLKPEQVKDIELLTKKDQNNNFPSVVIQRMMAAGKTLVLGTISVVKKALDKTKLSILVPPTSLYQSNTTSMQSRTYQYFKKKGNNFYFPRFNIPKKGDSTILKDYLQTVREIIDNTMVNRDYLILSPDSLSSFVNSYIEFLLNYNQDPDFKHFPIASLYAKIYQLFKQHGSIILDEVDMTMDPKKELNFPTDDYENYNMIAVTLLSDMVEFMLFDEEIIKTGLRIYSNDQASLTQENFKKCLGIVLDYIERQLNETTSLWHNYFYKDSEYKLDPLKVIEFFRDSNMATGKDWIIPFHESGNELLANALIIIKFQLHNFLEYSLKGTVNLNYGNAGNLRSEIRFAVPYVAANTPSSSSVFADRWETLLKTLLMVSATPCSRNIVGEVIDYVRKAIMNETAGVNPAKSTATYQNLKLILPENLNPTSLDKANPIHVQILHESLSLRTPAAIRLLFGYYINQVFGKMSFPTEQISCNALNLTSMFSSVQGYSGTIDNVNILPQIVIKDAYEDHLRNEKNNGGISLKLIKDSNDGVVVELSQISFTKSAVGMITDLMNLYHDEIDSISAIIDTGAFFKAFKNRQVAEAILNVCERIEAVLYCDEDSNQLEFLRESHGSYTCGNLETTDPDDITRTTQVELSKRFTFYDQRHITGSDILQPKEAHAIMTAGPRVLLRDILQGALRMRQFMSSQKVHLVTTTASREFYCSRINKAKLEMKVSDLLTLGALNEDDKQEQENDKLAFVKIDAEIRAFILDEVSLCFDTAKNDSECENVLELVQNSRSMLLRSIREIPLDLLHERTYQDTQSALRVFVDSRLSLFENFVSKSDSPIRDRFEGLLNKIEHMISDERKNETDSLLFYMKNEINTHLQLDIGTEVQLQTLNLALADVSMEILTENLPLSKIPAQHLYDLVQKLRSNTDKKTLNYDNDGVFISLDQLYNHTDMSPSNLPYLRNVLITPGKRSGVTLDLIKLYEPSYANANPYPIFSKQNLEGSHLLLQLTANNLKVLLVSPKHASKSLKDFLECTNDESKFWLCDLSGSVTATTDRKTRKGENVLDFIPQSRDLIFDLLIFNGSLSQIIANSILSDIYYKKWLRSNYFKERAMFLRIRMYVLLRKGDETFDDDDKNLEILRRMSMGQNNSTGESSIAGYPKEHVDKDFEESKRLQLIQSQKMFEISPEREKTIEFDITKELRAFFNIEDVNRNEWIRFDLPKNTVAPSTDEIIHHDPPREIIYIDVNRNEWISFDLPENTVALDLDTSTDEIIHHDPPREIIYIANFEDDPIETFFEEFEEPKGTENVEI